MSALYASSLRPGLLVTVFAGDRATVGVHEAGRPVSVSASRRITEPQELRDLALKCMAAAEVMEEAGDE